MQKAKIAIIVIAIIACAFGLMVATYTAFPGPEEAVNKNDINGISFCLIEDCVVGTRLAGVPLRTVELHRSEGLNCGDLNSNNLWCNSIEPRSIYYLIGNFIIYAVALSGGVYLANRYFVSKKLTAISKRVSK